MRTTRRAELQLGGREGTSGSGNEGRAKRRDESVEGANSSQVANHESGDYGTSDGELSRPRSRPGLAWQVERGKWRIAVDLTRLQVRSRSGPSMEISEGSEIWGLF